MASDQAKRQMATMKDLGEAETLPLHPKGRPARSVSGLVERGGNAQAGQAVRPEITITMLNDPIEGYPSSAANLNADAIEVAARLGGTAVERRILRIVSEDQDWITVAV